MINKSHFLLCLGLLFTQTLSAQFEQNWISVEQDENKHYQFEVYLQPGEAFSNPFETSAILESHPGIDAVKLDVAEQRVSVYAADANTAGEIGELLSSLDVAIDSSRNVMEQRTTGATDYFHPVHINDAGKLQTYLINLPPNTTERQQLRLKKQLEQKEMVVSIGWETENRMEVTVKDKFTATMLRTVLMQAY